MLPKALEEYIVIMLRQSDLSFDDKEALRKELTSHFHEQVNQLALQGCSEARAVSFILKHFGSPELIGRELFYVHRNIYFHNLFTFIHFISQIMKKNSKKILSILLLLITIWANYYFDERVSSYTMLGDCIEDMNGFEGQGRIYPEDFIFNEELGVFNQIESAPDLREEFHRDYLFFGISSGACQSYGPADYILNVDIDHDGTLTQDEIYISRSVNQVNIYLGTLHANLFASLFVLLILGDAIVLYLVLAAWCCKQDK